LGFLRRLSINLLKHEPSQKKFENEALFGGDGQQFSSTGFSG